MRINSERHKKIFGLVYGLCLLGILFDLVIINIDGSLGDLAKSFLFTPIVILLIIFTFYRGLPVFHYDSDGEVLNFTASEPNLKWLGRVTVRHFEFPKRKLAGYTIRSYPLRRVLIVSVKSKGGQLRKQRMTISYLRGRELRDLKRSLKGVVEKNKKA